MQYVWTTLSMPSTHDDSSDNDFILSTLCFDPFYISTIQSPCRRFVHSMCVSVIVSNLLPQIATMIKVAMVHFGYLELRKQFVKTGVQLHLTYNMHSYSIIIIIGFFSLYFDLFFFLSKIKMVIATGLTCLNETN